MDGDNSVTCPADDLRRHAINRDRLGEPSVRSLARTPMVTNTVMDGHFLSRRLFHHAGKLRSRSFGAKINPPAPAAEALNIRVTASKELDL